LLRLPSIVNATVLLQTAECYLRTVLPSTRTVLPAAFNVAAIGTGWVPRRWEWRRPFQAMFFGGAHSRPCSLEAPIPGHVLSMTESPIPRRRHQIERLPSDGSLVASVYVTRPDWTAGHRLPSKPSPAAVAGEGVAEPCAGQATSRACMGGLHGEPGQATQGSFYRWSLAWAGL
jgi:hypothetical protein